MSSPGPLNPLVVRFGAFGDMILLIPALTLLAQRYGAPCAVVGSGGWTGPILQRVPAAGPGWLLTSRRAPYWLNRSQRQFVAWLRQRPPGPVYVFESDDKTYWLLRRGGIRPEWICSYRELPRQAGEHIQAHGIRLARETPAALRGAPPAAPGPLATADARPVLIAADRADCDRWLRQRGLADAPLVLLQAGNKKTMRRGFRRRGTNVDYWPEENWARVIRAARTLLPGSRIILCGSPAERSLAEDIVARLGPEGVAAAIATDDLPIPRLLALLERAHSLISVNTGPAHAAAAMGCPLVVMFARQAIRSAALYAPQGTTAPVRVVLPAADSPDARVASIPPERVIAEWRGLLAAGGAAAN